MSQRSLRTIRLAERSWCRTDPDAVTVATDPPQAASTSGQRLSDRRAEDATRLRIGAYDSTPRPTCGFRTPQGKRKFAVGAERGSEAAVASLGHVATYVDPGAIRTRDLRFRNPLPLRTPRPCGRWTTVDTSGQEVTRPK